MAKPRLNDPLTADYLRTVLDYDTSTGVFTWRWRDVPFPRWLNVRRAGKVAHSGIDGGGYQRIDINRRHYLAHRLAWLHVHGAWPKDQIDHINRNPSDNRIANLREATHSQNNVRACAMRNSSTGVLGVFRSKSGRKWCVSVTRNGKTTHLGTYATIEEAKMVRENEVRGSYGEFSRLD